MTHFNLALAAPYPTPCVHEALTYAFQPIRDLNDGHIHGYEALLRGHKDAGFETIDAVFDEAFAVGHLHAVDMELRARACRNFFGHLGTAGPVLFFNLDNRILDSVDYRMGGTQALLSRHGVRADKVCFEISERHKIATDNAIETLSAYRKQGYRLAIDDFGAGYAGLSLLYDQQPEVLKIDRFFVSDIPRDDKKRVFVTAIVKLAHALDIKVVAEGVETREELEACRAVGCDLAQGWHIGMPEFFPAR